MVVRMPDGNTMSDEEWQRRQYDIARQTLERKWETLDYPVDRRTILDRYGQEKIAEAPKVNLETFLETLPNRSYQSDEDVFDTLDASWRKAEEAG